MSDETEKSGYGYPKSCLDEPGISTTVCVNNLAKTVKITGEGADLLRQAAGGPKTVQLERSATTPTGDQALWAAIRNRTDAIAFDRYDEFINRLLCAGADKGTPTCAGPQYGVETGASGLGAPSIRERRTALINQPSIYGIDAYQLLKVATQAFLLFETGIVITEERDPRTGAIVPTPNDEVPGEASRRGREVTFKKLQDELERYLTTNVGGIEARGLPYLKRIVNALLGFEGVDETGNVPQLLPYCEAIMQHRFTCPSMLELIWSYWHEEGMLVQTTNTIALRFQNRRRGARDPLTNLELDPLFPLNNILWGFIQDEYSRLSVQRRAYEYDHHSSVIG